MTLRSLIVAAAGLLAAAVLAGCGLGAGNAPSGASMTVTEDFGAKKVLSLSKPKVNGSETVMSLLRRNANVSTEYDGGFVSSIDGHAEAHSKAFDWFYYVNGEEAGKGAAETNVHSGDHIWWDLHNWSQSDHIPAVVGSFPAPFSTGLGGKRLPVVLECAVPHSEPCDAVSHRFDSLGIVGGFAAVGTVGEVSEEDSLKVLIGTWAQLQHTAVAQAILKGPAGGGVYVRILHGGGEFALLNDEGVVTRKLGAGAGMIAASRYTASSPVWMVTGTTPAGVQRAAAHFNSASLDGHFAIAISPSGTAGSVIALPDTGG